MIVVNTETIPGFEIVEIKGLVQGNTVRAKHVGRDIAAGFKNLVGGELKGYTELLTESRREAVARMMAQAEALGAKPIGVAAKTELVIMRVNYFIREAVAAAYMRVAGVLY